MYWWRKFLVAGLGALSLAGMGAATASADGTETLVAFHSMTPIGAGAPTARDLAGGGLPWMIKSGHGRVDSRGDVHVRVKGLVLVKTGSNPINMFEATVSCITPGGIANVTTTGFPASSAGDATIHARVALPQDCGSPEVFVGAMFGGQFRWFAVSNAEEDDD